MSTFDKISEILKERRSRMDLEERLKGNDASMRALRGLIKDHVYIQFQSLADSIGEKGWLHQEAVINTEINKVKELFDNEMDKPGLTLSATYSQYSRDVFINAYLQITKQDGIDEFYLFLNEYYDLIVDSPVSPFEKTCAAFAENQKVLFEFYNLARIMYQLHGKDRI